MQQPTATLKPQPASQQLQAITCHRLVELPSAISRRKSRLTLTIPQIIARNNREVRMRRFERRIACAINFTCISAGVFFTALFLALILFERLF